MISGFVAFGLVHVGARILEPHASVAIPASSIGLAAVVFDFKRTARQAIKRAVRSLVNAIIANAGRIATRRARIARGQFGLTAKDKMRCPRCLQPEE